MPNEPAPITDIKDVIAFSNEEPHLQLAWDSTSISRFKSCPRKYQYESVLGYRPKNLPIAMTFGTDIHTILEYHTKQHIADPLPHKEEVNRTILFALNETLEEKEVINSATGKKEIIKVPYHTEDTKRTRSNLLRLIVWYLEQYKDDNLEVLVLSNGKPAVELSFRFDTHERTHKDESFILCGHIDKVVRYNGNTWVLDYKTTGMAVDKLRDFYTLDDQMTLYTLAANIVTQHHVHGAILDVLACQVHANQFGRHTLPRNQDILNEWLAESIIWMRLAETYAEQNYWPKNHQACDKYGGCQFKEICALTPSLRQRFLDAQFIVAFWDPLRIR